MTNTSLPQNDSETNQRQYDLDKARKKYIYTDQYPSLMGIPMAKGLPEGETPSLVWIGKAAETAILLIKNRLENYSNKNPIEIALIIAKLTVSLLSKKGKATIKELQSVYNELTGDSDRPKDLDDYNKFFHSIPLPIVATNFQDDGIFARMRVAGQNPIVIEGIEALDDTFPVTDAIFQSVEHFLQDTIAQAGADNRLYLADYKALIKIENGNTDGVQKYSYAPKALFAIPLDTTDLKNVLLPIAIQCGQEPDGNPIFTPADGAAWNIAKSIVQTADFNYHELISHLGGTHLVTEPFVVSTHRQLSSKHPLNVLLLPHFEGTIFINYSAQESLVADGGAFDKMFSGTMQSNRVIVGQRVIGSFFNDEMHPRKIKHRKVEDSKLFYPYRDDGTKIWNAIHKWVSDYLDIYYKSDQDVLDDTELAAWAIEISTDSPTTGKVKGFGDNGDGKIITLAYLKEAVTMVIFTASAQHAAVNFTQKDFSGYPPNMPAAGYTAAPESKNKTEQDYLDLLPALKIANDQVDLTNLLSGVEYTRLGSYNRRLFNNDKVTLLVNEFQADLEEIEDEINRRNKVAAEAGITPYSYLLPSKIPQSINI